MNSNRVTISTELDNSGIEKGSRDIKGELGGVKGAVDDIKSAIKSAFSNDFSKSIANASARVNDLQRQLTSVSAALKDAIDADDDSAAQKYDAQRIRIYDQLEAARERLSNEIRAAAQKEAEAEIAAAKKATAAKKKEQEKQYKDATKSVRRLGSRFREIVSGALVFNLLSSGLRTMTEYFGKALKSNKEFAKSFGQLKGALMTAFQPIYEFVLPALISLMRVLAAVVQVIGQFFAVLSGKSTTQMAENAAALNEQANAIEGVGGAAKKAQKQLAGFDEINKLSDHAESSGGGGGSAGTISPSFETIEITDSLKNILELVGAVGAALLTWKIASAFTNSLSTVAGLAVAVGGAVLYAINLYDAFANGIDWDNLSGMILGAIALAGGLALAFGAVGAAIGLLIAGVGLVIVSLKEWITTGELSTEACLALELGILAIGAAISLLTGSWIPVAIAAVVGAVIAIGTQGDKIKEILNELDIWLQGVFEKDWTDTFGLLGTSINGFFYGFKQIWDNVKLTLEGIVEFISGIFTGDWDQAINGLVKIFEGAAKTMKNVALFPFNALAEGLRELARKILPESWKEAINNVIEIVNKFISWLNSSLSFTIDPITIAGKEIFSGKSFNLLDIPQIPPLARGAVLPPNKPFLAMVGDQRHGTNIEAPLSTIQEAVALVMRDQTSAIMAGFNASVEVQREILSAVLGIQIGDDVIAAACDRYKTKLVIQRGG